MGFDRQGAKVAGGREAGQPAVERRRRCARQPGAVADRIELRDAGAEVRVDARVPAAAFLVEQMFGAQQPRHVRGRRQTMAHGDRISREALLSAA